MKKTFSSVFMFLVVFIVGCSAPLKIDMVSEVPEKGIKSLVLLNDNRFSSLVRRSLIKNGFQIKALPSIFNVTHKSEKLDISFDKAEAQFGIRHGGRLSSNNPCYSNGNASHFTEYEFELVNMRTNNTIFFVSKGGWTAWCTGGPTTDTTDLFGDLSKELGKLILRP